MILISEETRQLAEDTDITRISPTLLTGGRNSPQCDLHPRPWLGLSWQELGSLQRCEAEAGGEQCQCRDETYQPQGAGECQDEHVLSEGQASRSVYQRAPACIASQLLWRQSAQWILHLLPTPPAVI
jgi:hypothetical protein